MNFQDKYKDKMTSEPVKVKTSSFGNLDRFFCHLKKVFITENSRENKYIYKTCGLKTGSIKVTLWLVTAYYPGALVGVTAACIMDTYADIDQ